MLSSLVALNAFLFYDLIYLNNDGFDGSRRVVNLFVGAARLQLLHRSVVQFLNIPDIINRSSVVFVCRMKYLDARRMFWRNYKCRINDI